VVRLRCLALALLLLAAVVYLQAIGTGFASAWLKADAYGMEIPVPERAEQRAAGDRRAAELAAEARREAWLARGLLLLALAAGLAAQWRARHRPRRTA